VKVWQALIVLIALIWIGRTPRKRAIIATTILLLLAIGIGPAR
jgi:type II secretory pathway component PulM